MSYDMPYRKLQNVANQCFDKGWSHAVTNQTLDLIDNCGGGQFSVVCSTTVRIQLLNGTFHEDTSCVRVLHSDKGYAIVSAKQKSIFEAMKNTMNWFGYSIAEKTSHIGC